MANRSRADIRRGIHSRIRKKVRGTTERPRLAVFRSINHIYAQVIDDNNGATLASASSVEGVLKVKSGGNMDGAAIVGKAIAERAIEAGIEEVVFDRGGYIYHGRVKALLNATREAGLNKNEAAGKPEKEKKVEKPKGKTADKKKKKGKEGGSEKAAAKKAAGKKSAPKKSENESKPAAAQEKQKDAVKEKAEKPEQKKEVKEEKKDE